MSLTTKQRKKLDRKLKSADERIKELMIEQVIFYFVLMCIVLSWDRIAQAFYLRYNPGISGMQWLGASVCLFQCARFARKIKS